MCVSIMEGQRKSIDPKSKASASLDRATRRYERGAIQGTHDSTIPTGKRCAGLEQDGT